MPSKKQIQAELQSASGGARVISFGRLAKYLGVCPKTARKLLEGVPSYEIGQKRCYFTSDIALWLENKQMINA